MALTTVQEFLRVVQMLSGLTVTVPMMLMTQERINKIEMRASANATLAVLNEELRKKFKAITRPEDYVQMGQAYEAYAEASFWLAMADRGVPLERTPETGQFSKKRPDFVYHHNAGSVYFEVKALDIAAPLTRHKELAQKALVNAADLEERARVPGVHFGDPLEVSGPLPGMTLVERLRATIDKIVSNVKSDQIHYGPTVLVVDLGRFDTIPCGPSSLLPVFFHDEPPAESCVSGELWQIGLGRSGEQLFNLPDFDGKSNLAGHQDRDGILIAYPGLMAITFIHPRWSKEPELFTLWNPDFDRGKLTNTLTISEHDVEHFLYSYSDGFNDTRNENGWPYRVIPLRPKVSTA